MSQTIVYITVSLHVIRPRKASVSGDRHAHFHLPSLKDPNHTSSHLQRLHHRHRQRQSRRYDWCLVIIALMSSVRFFSLFFMIHTRYNTRYGLMQNSIHYCRRKRPIPLSIPLLSAPHNKTSLYKFIHTIDLVFKALCRTVFNRSFSRELQRAQTPLSRSYMEIDPL